MFTTSLMFSCSFETRTNIGNVCHAFWGRHHTPLLHVQAHSLPRKVAWHGENTELDKSASFLSFPPFLSLFLNNHLLNYTVLSVSFVTFLFFFRFDYLVFINTIHPSIPKAKEKNARCLLVCFARVLGWSKGGLWFQVQADKKGGIRPCLPLPTSQKCSENEMKEPLWSYPMRVFMTALVMPCKHHHYYYTTLWRSCFGKTESNLEKLVGFWQAEMEKRKCSGRSNK